MKKLSIFMTALVLFASCSKESADSVMPFASNQAAVKSVQARPFYAIINAAVDVNSTNPPTACSGDAPFAAPDFLLDGEADHMGNLDGQASTLHHDACNLSITDMQLTTEVSGQLVAANGDKVFYTGNDVVDVTGFVTGQSNLGAITGTWTLDGGTGRFEGATGTVTIDGTVDFQTFSFTCEIQGTIVY